MSSANTFEGCLAMVLAVLLDVIKSLNGKIEADKSNKP